MVDRHVHHVAVVSETAGRAINELDGLSRQQLYFMGALASDTPIPEGVAFTDAPEQAGVRQTLLEQGLIQESPDQAGHVQIAGHVSLLVRHLVPPDEAETFRLKAQERYLSEAQGTANIPGGWEFYLNAEAHAASLGIAESDQPAARDFWDRIILANAASGDFQTSTRLARTAYDIWEPGTNHAGMAWRLAVNSNYLGEHRLAARYAYEAAAEHQNHNGDADRGHAYRLGLGRAAYFQGDIPVATGLFEQLLEEGRQKLEAPKPSQSDMKSLAPVLANLSQIDFDAGRYDGAYDKAHEARVIWETTIGAEHRFTLMSTAREARALAHAGEPTQAEALLRQAHEQLRATVGEDHHDTIYTAAALAESLRLNDKQKEGNQIAVNNYDRRCLDGPFRPRCSRRRFQLFLSRLPLLPSRYLCDIVYK
jgi:hypothetical protein